MADPATIRTQLLDQLALLGALPDDVVLASLDPTARTLLLNQYAAILDQIYPLSDKTCIRPILNSAGYGFGFGTYELASLVLLAQDEIDLLPELLLGLGSARPGPRRLAADILRFVGGPAEGPALLTAVQDPQPLVRQFAVAALSLRPGPATDDALLQAFLDPAEGVRQAAAATQKVFLTPPSDLLLKAASIELGLKCRDLVGQDKAHAVVLLNVQTLKDPDTVYDYFIREQDHIIDDYVTRQLEVPPAPSFVPSVRRTLVLDIRHGGQSKSHALADLGRVLRAQGTVYAPDGRGLWDEVRFIEGSDENLTLTAPTPIP